MPGVGKAHRCIPPRVAQVRSERAPYKREVDGSIPSTGTIKPVGVTGSTSDFESDSEGSNPSPAATGYQRLKSWRARNPDKAREINRAYMRAYRARLKEKK